MSKVYITIQCDVFILYSRKLFVQIPGLQEDQHLHLCLELQEPHLAVVAAAVVVLAEAAVAVAAAGVPIMVVGAEGQVKKAVAL